MSEEIQEEMQIEEPKKTRKHKGPTQEQEIAKLKSDVKQIKELLHKMKSAIGLPENLMPKLDD